MWFVASSIFIQPKQWNTFRRCSSIQCVVQRIAQVSLVSCLRKAPEIKYHVIAVVQDHPLLLPQVALVKQDVVSVEALPES